MVQLKVYSGINPADILIFQFLMVQLKDPQRCHSPFDSGISIPYGSIKSCCYEAILDTISYFNSLWFN